MPAVTIFRNPGKGKKSNSRLISKRVLEIRYKHAEDGKWYRHPFGVGVCAELLPDGSVRLFHVKGKPVARDF